MDQSDRYTRAIRTLKFVLPACAVLILISIFALTKEDAIRDGLIFNDSEMTELSQGQKITNPNFSGVTDDGYAFTLRAKEALPNAPKPNSIDLIEPQVELNTTSGVTISSKSDLGRINFKAQKAHLEGGVTLSTSNGFVAKSADIEVNLKDGSAKTLGAVEARGPVGSINAGSMKTKQVLSTKTSDRQLILQFEGGVRLIYLPKDAKKAN